MTQAYMAPRAKTFYNTNAFYVSAAGSDGGNGSIDDPYATIQTAITASAAGDQIWVGPGTYTEQLTIAAAVNIGALIPGSATVQFGTTTQAVVNINGAAAGLNWNGINITHTDNAATSTCILVDNSGAGVTGSYVFTNSRLTAGTGTARALNFIGNGAAALTVKVDSPRVIGNILATPANGGDMVLFYNTTFVNGPANWLTVAGTNGVVRLVQCRLLGTGGTESINYGNAGATTAILDIRNSTINGYLNLNTTGAGYVNMEKSSVLYTVANQANQIIRYRDGDYIKVQMQNIDLDNVAASTLYTVPAGRQFFPEWAFTTNRLAATGGALNYRVNGSGNGTIVAAVGAGALATGTTVEACLADVLIPADTVQFDVTAASTTATDRGECTILGRLV